MDPMTRRTQEDPCYCDGMQTSTSLDRMSEDLLLKRFADLIRRDRNNTAQLLSFIAEIDERKLWAKHAFPSMFAFCVQRFHLSESATAKRIWAARTARRFPMILQMVSDGELHLSGIAQIAKHLTADNHREILARAKHKTTREIERLVAELVPRPDVPSRVRALPRPTRSAPVVLGALSNVVNRETAESDTSMPHAAKTSVAQGTSDEGGAADSLSRPIQQHKQIVPLAPRRYKVEVTVDQRTHDTLRVLQDVLGHSIPDGDPARVISCALDLLLDETLKKKAALTSTPRQSSTGRATSGKSKLKDTGTPHSSDTDSNRKRAIPASVRREVWKRDLGRCAFVDKNGRRCPATRRLEFHHEVPFGKGGKHEADNIALLCQAHNQYQADLDFGQGFMRCRREGATNVPRGTFSEPWGPIRLDQTKIPAHRSSSMKRSVPVPLIFERT